MKFKSYVNQAFPKQNSKWKLIISISIFVALFLIVFQPFGLSFFNAKYKILILSAYGLVTFCTLFFNLVILESIFKKFFDERNWKIWKEFIWLMWVIFSIGLGNAFYTAIIFDSFRVNLWFLLQFQFITLIVGIIPITVLILTKQKYLLKKHINSSDELNENLKSKTDLNQNNTISFSADNEKLTVTFNIKDFLFMESSGNYVELYLINEGKTIRKTFRSTLKRAQDFFKDSPEILQCHRAYIVNTNKIINSTGNSQGLQLSLENCEFEIPVSRGFVNLIRDIIN